VTPTKKGSYRVFTLAGIGVFVHWSWFIVALYSIQYRTHAYSSMVWNAMEYLSLFLIVLTHEFGHQLACRQVGGKTHDIVLWPLGGVAYVTPPERPGAQLWSIAAGPLVNVILAPVLIGLVLVSIALDWPATHPNAHALLRNVSFINLGLLIFNLMPVYPLDGGQILRSLLWFVFGRTKSLLIASGFGFFGVAGFIGLAIWLQSIWLGIIAVFLLINCWRGLVYARLLARADNHPRHDGYACPACHTAPAVGNFWLCGRCGKGFDPFLTNAACPHCGVQFSSTRCPHCGVLRPWSEWSAPKQAGA
jgi:Zn-dependent protease